MIRTAFALALFAATPVLAQADVLFGSGKPPVFKEEEFDRRFQKSRLNRAILKGTQDENCQKLLGGLLTAVAEIGPTLHKRDQDFYVDPYLLQGVSNQLSTPRFPAQLFLTAMVRRVLIDRKLPKDWLELGTQLAAKVPMIDVGKLRYLADGLQPVDSFEFSLPALRQRYEVEVTNATSAARGGADAAFKEAYLDRDVAWGDLTLVDLVPEKRRKKGEGEPTMIARLEWREPRKSDAPDYHDPMSMLRGGKPQAVVKLTAQLAPDPVPRRHPAPEGEAAARPRPALGARQGRLDDRAARGAPVRGPRLVAGRADRPELGGALPDGGQRPHRHREPAAVGVRALRLRFRPSDSRPGPRSRRARQAFDLPRPPPGTAAALRGPRSFPRRPHEDRSRGAQRIRSQAGAEGAVRPGREAPAGRRRRRRRDPPGSRRPLRGAKNPTGSAVARTAIASTLKAASEALGRARSGAHVEAKRLDSVRSETQGTAARAARAPRDRPDPPRARARPADAARGEPELRAAARARRTRPRAGSGRQARRSSEARRRNCRRCDRDVSPLPSMRRARSSWSRRSTSSSRPRAPGSPSS